MSRKASWRESHGLCARRFCLSEKVINTGSVTPDPPEPSSPLSQFFLLSSGVNVSMNASSKRHSRLSHMASAVSFNSGGR